MEHDYSDILGSHTLPAIRGGKTVRWPVPSLGLNTAYVLAVLLVGYVAGIKAWRALLIWREKAYKLSMRRRHGIPDNDHRPFNVAYAAVMRTRQENEAAKRKLKLGQPIATQDHPHTTSPDQTIRHRPGSQLNVHMLRPNGPVNGLPGRLNPSSDNMFTSMSTFVSDSNHQRSHSTLANPLNFADRYNPSTAAHIDQPRMDISPLRAGPRPKSIDPPGDIDGRKRGFDGDKSNDPDSKKTRVEGDELIDGDEDAEWQGRRDTPRRGAKRVLLDEEENDTSRDKRARKISLEKAPQPGDEEMDVDGHEDEDEVAELRHIPRGKKRDRAEAGSTFDGDDDNAHETGDAEARRQRRKRQTIAKRKSDAAGSVRGQKRDRDVDSDPESGDGPKVSRKKRGKKLAVQTDDDGRSDVSMDGSQTSGKGRQRRIGDEWESNGVKYKIGPNGQRLRQALIKKARQKFTMPKDSQHPDRQANLEVFVETWLTEDEFKEAKERLLLAWQDSPKASAEPEMPSADHQSSQARAGKNLLWSSNSTHLGISSLGSPIYTTPTKSDPKEPDFYRQSIATNLGLRLDPFQQRSQAASGKRIASAARVASVFGGRGIHPGSPGSPGLADSTNGSPRGGYKVFSKWEKQDLEAKAMMKMREANRQKEAEKEKEKMEKEKAEKERKEKENAALAATSIPTITLTKPDETKPPASETKPSMFSFGHPPTSEPPKLASNNSTAPIPEPPAASAAPFTLPLPPTALPQPEDKPPIKPPAIFPTQAPSLSTGSSLSFGNPSAPPLKPGGNAFGGRPIAGNNRAEQQPKPSPFGFSAPSAPTKTTLSGDTTRTSFSFPLTTTQAPQASVVEKKDGPASGGESLLSRLGPASTSVQPASQPQQDTAAFSFSKPASNAAKPTPIFGMPNVPQNTTPTTTTPVTTAPSASGPSSGLKFNFGFSAKPAASVPPPASTTAPSSSTLSEAPGNHPTSSLSGGPGNAFSSSPNGAVGNSFSSAPSGAPDNTPSSSSSGAFRNTSSSSLSGALGDDTSKPAASSFSFKPPPARDEDMNGTTPGPSAPKINFMAPPSGSAFGTTSTMGGNKAEASTSQSNDSSVKSAFAGFGGAGKSAFSSNFQGTSTSSFGSGASTNVFGGGGALNAFGASGSTAKAGEAPKTFGFGSSSSPSTPAANTGEPAKSAFSFGSQATTTTPISFKFGDTSKNSTTPQAPQPATGQSVFGGTSSSGPVAFGFSAPTTSNGSTSGFGGFGNAAAPTGQQQQ